MEGVYVISTGIVLIFCNLGERTDGSVSAYSVFNKGFYQVLGTFNMEHVDGMFGRDRVDKDQHEFRDNHNQNAAADEINQDFEGLTAD